MRRRVLSFGAHTLSTDEWAGAAYIKPEPKPSRRINPSPKKRTGGGAIKASYISSRLWPRVRGEQDTSSSSSTTSSSLCLVTLLSQGFGSKVASNAAWRHMKWLRSTRVILLIMSAIDSPSPSGEGDGAEKGEVGGDGAEKGEGGGGGGGGAEK